MSLNEALGALFPAHPTLRVSMAAVSRQKTREEILFVFIFVSPGRLRGSIANKKIEF
jgi:hypothetical protein